MAELIFALLSLAALFALAMNRAPLWAWALAVAASSGMSGGSNSMRVGPSGSSVSDGGRTTGTPGAGVDRGTARTGGEGARGVGVPGGGVTGLPGMNAAREILKDWPRRRR